MKFCEDKDLNDQDRELQSKFLANLAAFEVKIFGHTPEEIQDYLDRAIGFKVLQPKTRDRFYADKFDWNPTEEVYLTVDIYPRQLSLDRALYLQTINYFDGTTHTDHMGFPITQQAYLQVNKFLNRFIYIPYDNRLTFASSQIAKDYFKKIYRL